MSKFNDFVATTLLTRVPLDGLRRILSQVKYETLPVVWKLIWYPKLIGITTTPISKSEMDMLATKQNDGTRILLNLHTRRQTTAFPTDVSRIRKTRKEAIDIATGVHWLCTLDSSSLKLVFEVKPPLFTSFWEMSIALMSLRRARRSRKCHHKIIHIYITYRCSKRASLSIVR